MTVRRAIWTAVAAAVCLIYGCGTRGTTPVGSNLLDEDPGGVIELPLVRLAEGRSRFESIYPFVHGSSEELRVGQMHGLAFRTLLRFRVPVDSLARAAGGTGAADLGVTALRLRLTGYPSRQRLDGTLSVRRPEGDWNESSVFVDTLNFVEIDFPSSPILGANTVSAGDTLVVDLPPSVGEDAIRANSQEAQVEVLLAPSGTEDFLKVLASREARTDSLRPRLLFSYDVGGNLYLYETGASEDTFLDARSDGGAPPDLLILSAGIFYASLLRFDFPDSIPAGATVNSVQLQVDVDQTQSFYDVLPFRVDRVEINPDTGDTTFSRSSASLYVHNVAPGAPHQTFMIDRTLVQGWMSGKTPNNGMALRANLDDPEVDWVVLQNPRLRVVYSLLPGDAY